VLYAGSAAINPSTSSGLILSLSKYQNFTTANLDAYPNLRQAEGGHEGTAMSLYTKNFAPSFFVDTLRVLI